MDDQRKAITQLLHETGQSMAELSRKCGLNHAYFEQYLKRGSPRELPERTLRLLEDVHGISREGGMRVVDGPRPPEFPTTNYEALASLDRLIAGKDSRVRDLAMAMRFLCQEADRATRDADKIFKRLDALEKAVDQALRRVR